MEVETLMGIGLEAFRVCVAEAQKMRGRVTCWGLVLAFVTYPNGAQVVTMDVDENASYSKLAWPKDKVRIALPAFRPKRGKGKRDDLEDIATLGTRLLAVSRVICNVAVVFIDQEKDGLILLEAARYSGLPPIAREIPADGSTLTLTIFATPPAYFASSSTTLIVARPITPAPRLDPAPPREPLPILEMDPNDPEYAQLFYTGAHGVPGHARLPFVAPRDYPDLLKYISSEPMIMKDLQSHAMYVRMTDGVTVKIAYIDGRLHGEAPDGRVFAFSKRRG